MAYALVGNIEVRSLHGRIRLRCAVDGAELLLAPRETRLFNAGTTRFSAEHAHAEGPGAGSDPASVRRVSAAPHFLQHQLRRP